MKTCRACGRALPEQASFCGACGALTNESTETPTKRSESSPDGFDYQDVLTAHLDANTVLSNSNAITSLSVSNADISDTPTVLLGGMVAEDNATQWMEEDDEEDEEKKRRKAALLGLALPALGEVISGGNFPIEAAPKVQGPSQPGSAPSIQGTPGANMSAPSVPSTPVLEPVGPGWTPPSTVGQQPAALSSVSSGPTITTPPTGPSSSPPGGSGSPGGNPGGSPGSNPGIPQGCLPWLTIVLIVLIILSSIFGAGLTVFAPAIKLTGSGNVARGSSLHVHGSSFIPGSAIALTLDKGEPLQSVSRQTTSPVASALLFAMPQFAGKGTLSASAGGTFDATIAVGMDWTVGKHTIHASETLSPRGASLEFTVLGEDQTPTLGTTPTPTPAPGATDTPTPTPTPEATDNNPTTPAAPGTTQRRPGLNGINPNSLSLGPLDELTNQSASARVTLSTLGAGPLSWTASGLPSWLQLDHTSGRIQAPGSQQIMVTAAANGLKPGTYTTTVTFNSSSGNRRLSLNVSFTIRAACITASTKSLSFTGVAGIFNPGSQIVTLTNCAFTSKWSGAIPSGGNWLSISPAGNNSLNGGATQGVTVSADPVGAKLGAGTHQGQIVFTDGSSQAVVSVTLIVENPPKLTVAPARLNPNNCRGTDGGWACTVTLTAVKPTDTSPTVNIRWSSSTNAPFIININPTTGIISSGQAVQVDIGLPDFTCSKTPVTITFTGPGPANTATVDASGLCQNPVG